MYDLIGSVLYLQTVFLSKLFNKLPCWFPPSFDDISTSNSALAWLLYGIHTYSFFFRKEDSISMTIEKINMIRPGKVQPVT